MSCACLGPRYSLYLHYQCRASDIASVGTTFNVFRSDAVRAEHQTNNLPAPSGCATFYAADAVNSIFKKIKITILRCPFLLIIFNFWWKQIPAEGSNPKEHYSFWCIIPMGLFWLLLNLTKTKLNVKNIFLWSKCNMRKTANTCNVPQ